VARIIMAKPENAVATSGTTPAIDATAPVAGPSQCQASQPWTSTGITVRKGQTITFATTGEVQLSDDATTSPTRRLEERPVRRRTADRNVARGRADRPHRANGQAFAIGEQTTIVAPARRSSSRRERRRFATTRAASRSIVR
jgi:hypothetical protein